ncbi:hypothetical protein [Pyxidicoccus caerfyrddinensis]|uniref:hypothetical protein n=1 Tax=Pyxidicoccus caerfyrddinensis TaxID=2709663 RepID=UPI001F0748B6|nr:hypothetical protein [Pyxidicoccus caerfyrddinensis]
MPTEPARTYNQNHVPRKYERGRRRVSVYVSWTYPGEANRDVTVMDNRYSTMTDVRRVLWPEYENPRFSDPMRFQQGIAGSLELFFWAWTRFQQVAGEVTGHPVPVFQRVDQAGFSLPLDERVLGDADTLLLFGLDHMATEQAASAGEVEALRNFLKREGTCLVIGPHHDVGASTNLEERAMEYAHHGDALVPRQQRFGLFCRSLLRSLGIPVENRFGLRPATAGKRIAPLTIQRDLDTRGYLTGVTSFNLHFHLPHYEVLDPKGKAARVLARQPIDLTRPPHPFTAAGNREFNTCVWVPPEGERAGDVLVVDSTVFSTLFGVDESLERFWKNLCQAR